MMGLHFSHLSDAPHSCTAWGKSNVKSLTSTSFKFKKKALSQSKLCDFCYYFADYILVMT